MPQTRQIIVTTNFKALRQNLELQLNVLPISKDLDGHTSHFERSKGSICFLLVASPWVTAFGSPNNKNLRNPPPMSYCVPLSLLNPLVILSINTSRIQLPPLPTIHTQKDNGVQEGGTGD